MRKGLFFAFFIGILITSCDSPQQPENSFHLTVQGNFDDMAFVQHFTLDSLNIIDTLLFEAGQAEKQIEAVLPFGYYQLNFPGGAILRFQASEGDEIHISDLELPEDAYQSPLTYKIEGNKDSKTLHGLHMLMVNTFQQLDSIDVLRQRIVKIRTTDPSRDSLLQHYFISDRDVFFAHQDSLKSMIQRDTTRLVNVYAFMHYIGNVKVLPEEKEYPYYLAVNNGIGSTEFADHPLYLSFNREVEVLRRRVQRNQLIIKAAMNLNKGELAPSIQSTTIEGEPFELKSLRGKVVLIDFWKLDCYPCRQNHLHLAEMYKKYNGRGFEVLSVNLDGGEDQSEMLLKNAWRQAVLEDNMTWPHHISDLNGWESRIVLDYGVENIPRTVLIDEEGIILGIQLHGDELDTLLEGILQ